MAGPRLALLSLLLAGCSHTLASYAPPPLAYTSQLAPVALTGEGGAATTPAPPPPAKANAQANIFSPDHPVNAMPTR